MEKEQGFYLKLRQKVLEWINTNLNAASPYAKYIIWAPDMFYLVWKLSIDPRVPISERLKLMAAVAYFISPFDLIPEAIIGPVAWADDLVLTAYVLHGLLSNTPPELLKQYWPGDEDVFEVIKKVVAAADRLVGKRISDMLRRRSRERGA
ncbi:MAG: DUF1232 domain-containing protein [candidate division KSB1 bacterium]|nr:DUF1232 domain-containing protein [candidate division KSB1 bacterium]